MNQEASNDFGTPQRQSSIGVAVEMAYLFQKIIKASWPVLLIIILRLESTNLIYSGLILILSLVLITVFSYLQYRNFTFYINHKSVEFILNSGIINKNRVVVKLSKIQQVNINQSLIQKLANVYALEIETAGSTEVEVTIKAISESSALALQSQLMQAPVTPSDDNQQLYRPAKPFIKINIPSLLKIGITSKYLESFAVLTAFFYAVFNNIKDIWWNGEEDENQLNELFSSFLLPQPVLLLIGIFIAIVLLFNVIRTLIKYFDLTIRKKGDTLVISYGLFNSRNTLIQPRKVQLIKLSSNYFQRKMNMLELSIHQPSGDKEKDRKSNIHIPGCDGKECEAIIQFIFGQQPQKGAALKPNIRKIISSIGIFIVVPLIGFLLGLSFNSLLNEYLILIPIYLVLVTLLIYFSYRNNKLFINKDFIIKTSGIWDITSTIIEPHKIQAISTKQNFWHQRSDIGHLILHTAGDDIAFQFANFTKIKAYVNYWLYQIEVSKKDWM